jgi:cyanophycin synthetase
MMEAELLESGFPAEHIEVIPDEQAAIQAALEGAERGDLVIVFADKVSRSWKQVIYFKPLEGEKSGSAPPPAHSSPALPPLTGGDGPGSDPVMDGALVIADERGVRLARERDD